MFQVRGLLGLAFRFYKNTYKKGFTYGYQKKYNTYYPDYGASAL